MTAVMMGIDPHKASHTAVAVNHGEEQLGRQQVRACADQARQLIWWARAWPERTWAVEGATGLGYLLAQQLVAAGGGVLDVQSKLAARVRLLEAGDTGKKDRMTRAWSRSRHCARGPYGRPQPTITLRR